MKILILGASGFLGGHCFELLKTEFNVLGTVNSSNSNDEFIKLDVTKEEEVKDIIENFNPDIILWTLMSNTSEKYLVELGLDNILKYISGNKKIIFISTNAVFRGKNGAYKENNKPEYRNSRDALAEYSNAKIDGEKIVISHGNYIIIRPGMLYGKDINGIWDKKTTNLINLLEHNKEFVRTENMYNTFVKVEEMAKAIVKLIKIDYKGIIHLGPLTKNSYFEFYKDMAKQLKLNSNLIKSNRKSIYECIKEDNYLDFSLNTFKANKLLGEIFSNI